MGTIECQRWFFSIDPVFKRLPFLLCFSCIGPIMMVFFIIFSLYLHVRNHLILSLFFFALQLQIRSPGDRVSVSIRRVSELERSPWHIDYNSGPSMLHGFGTEGSGVTFSCDAPHYSSSSARAMHRDGPGPSLVKSYIMLVMPQHSLSFRQDLWSFMVLMFLISLLRPTSMALRQEVLFQCKLRSNRTSRILQLSNERDIYSSPSQSKDNCRLADFDVPLALFPPR